MGNKIKIITAIVLIGTGILFSGCGCKESTSKGYKLSLEIWGTVDADQALSDALENYRKLNPAVTAVTYKKIASDTYQKEVIEALASSQGPDIFLINNTWLPSFKDKLAEAPQIPGESIINEQKFKQNFVDTCSADLLDEGKIYALPLSVDSLALYYNRDLFNQAGITEPPKNWEEFSEAAQKLTRLNAYNEIIQSGAALGTAKNINRSTDILNMLMLQSGTEIVSSDGRVNFEYSQEAKSALGYYAQFAKSGSLYYSWNNNMHYSLDAFAEGNLAMMFNYSWHLETIKAKSPKLNLSVANVPQFPDRPKVNFANYWALSVAKNKIAQSEPYGGQAAPQVSNETRIKEAWLLLTYLTTKPDGSFKIISSGSPLGKVADPNFDPAASYLEKTGEPAARRDLIEKQKSDPVIGVFAENNLVAKNWKQSDPEEIEGIFAGMIEEIYQGKTTIDEALVLAGRRIEMLGRN